MTLAVMLTGPAFAQCAPEPTVANGTTTCRGTDVDGLRVTTFGTRVLVDPSATVRGAGGPAIAVRIGTTGSGGAPITLSVAGLVDGGADAGISLVAQDIPNNTAPQGLALTVAAGGRVTGINGVSIGIALSRPFISAGASIDNSGTIAGTGGVALLSTDRSNASFSSIINRAGGTIGAIIGPVGTLANAGTIDGGNRSAVDFVTSSIPFGAITNSGRISSTSAAATLANLSNFRTVTNSGTIENLGTGAAIATPGDLIVDNSATGRIAGTTAIDARTTLRLTNAGVIAGDVVIGGLANNTGSTIDSTTGRITGALRLGAAIDTLIASFDGTRLQYGIDGTIDGGAGVDTVQARLATDASFAAPLSLPTGFERLTLIPAAGTTATLAPGFVLPGTLEIGGAGTLLNRAALSSPGQILLSTFTSNDRPVVINAGSIASTNDASGVYAVSLSTFAGFENRGAITATRDAVSLSGSGPIINSGTIVAGGTALSASSSNFTNTATGVIRSTGGVGLSFSGSSFGIGPINAGRIEGATVALQLSSMFSNTGTIAGSQTGVTLGSSGTLDNRAGGTVSGDGTAIIAQAPNGAFTFNNTIANAGAITGNVVLGDNRTLFNANNNRFFALPGGTLNGNLALGQGDLLVTELVNTGTGAFAGITGNVTATNARLVLRVRQNATAAAPTSPGFASVGYELLNGSALTLTAPAAIRPLTLAGRGSVDVTADIAATTGPAIQSTFLSNALGETSTATMLAITSRGTLNLTRTDGNIFPEAAVALGGEDSFTNIGTIVASDRAVNVFSRFSAISGGFAFGANTGTSVINSGTIMLDGTIGISDAQTVTNTGSILQVAGGRAATGIRVTTGSGPITIANSGTIQVAGNGVQVGGTGVAITNSGRITSTGDSAIVATNGFNAIVRNTATGTIAGGTDRAAIQLTSGRIVNAGTITGTVDLGYATFGGRSSERGTYVDNGGTLAGGLLFGRGNDFLFQTGSTLDISGIVDGGEGIDVYGRALNASGTVALGSTNIRGFEDALVQARGTGTVVTTTADVPFAGNLYVAGNGAVNNTATVAGALTTSLPFSPLFPIDPDQLFPADQMLASVTNTGTVTGGVVLRAGAFINGGTVTNDGSSAAVVLRGSAITVANTGTITGGGLNAYATSDPSSVAAPTISMRNTGTVSTGSTGVSLSTLAQTGQSVGTVSLDNAGTIEATRQGGTGVLLENYKTSGAVGEAIVLLTNSGTIRANGGGVPVPADRASNFVSSIDSDPAATVIAFAQSGTIGITNAASGTIEATGALSAAVYAGSAIDFGNAGTIRGGAGTVLAVDDRLTRDIGTPYLAGAIQTLGGFNDRVVNTGTIVGSIALGGGNDRIENLERIEGNVFLGTGDDRFLQRASATLIGTVDAGAGNDLFTVDATGGGAINGDQFVNFERFSQIGEGSVAYSGTFRFNTVGLTGGTVTVAAGQTLASTGPVTITGSDTADTVVNDGTIVGTVSLASGDDRVVNRGAIGGAVLLGAGDDTYVEGPNARVAGGVDGGAGTDTYTALLAGDRQGLGGRTGFERLGVEGSGTLGLTLDQGFEATSLTDTGLTVALNGFSIGRVTGSNGAERLTVDGDVVSASLGAGDDVLALGATRLAGLYDGGAGSDVLRLTAAGPVTLAGTATGFEQVALTGNALVVTGSLGSADAPLAFGDGAQSVTVAANGTLAGLVDLGAGDDLFRLAAGGIIAGTVAGGTGADTATLELAGNRTISGAALSGFETLATDGRGTLTLTGTHVYDRVTTAADLVVAGDAALTARQINFAASDQRFAIAGRFAGSVDGGAGTDTIAVSGGNASGPVAFGDVTGIESLAMTGGYATVSGSAAFGRVDIAGGRFAGLGGSTIAASQIDVRQGATFGSVGTVNGNLSVAGTLDLGTSPGTMTVNGAVSLGATSLAVLELAPTAQDKLVVNGALSIVQGATLQLVPTGALRPGTSYDLVTASGGITGSFSTVLKPDSLFGFVIQRADRIQLLGQFLADASFSPQASRSVAYVNSVLAQQAATSPLFAALPALLTANGASNPAAFAQLTPEPYASATQVGVENGLALAGLARGPGFAADRTEPGGFTFAQAIGSWYRLAADTAEGVGQTRTTNQGFLGGVGYGNRDWSIGAFGGYLDSRQRIDTLGARTDVDGWVGGIQGRYDAGGFGFGASVAYNDGSADTRRALPGAANAIGRYDLNSWVGDASVHYSLTMGDWALRPRAGLTYVQTRRGGLVETGGPFALTVARDRHVTGFADAGIGFGRAQASPAALRPFVMLGARYQLQGRRTDALAGHAGGPLTLSALGAARARLVGTVNAGGTYRLTPGLDVFSTVSAQTGRDDHREAVSAGLRFRL